MSATLVVSPPSNTHRDSHPMRVLHLYSGNLYGGVEALLATLARWRSAAPGMDPEFALCFDGRIAGELRDAGVPVHDLGAVRFARPWTLLAARRRLGSLLAARRPDVVVSHACWSHAAFAPTVRRAGVPLAFWMHDAVEGTHWLERRSAKMPPDLAIVNSQHTATTLPRLFPDVVSEILYYPVAPPQRPPGSDRATVRAEVRRELGSGPEDVVIVQASRLERWKGQALHLEALGHLRDRTGWVAWLAGGVQRPHEQVYLDELQARAQTLGIADRVRFLGQRSDVPRLLDAADIHCQPNAGPEPFGIAYVEALYAGLPAVSTRMGGAAEIITEDCGVLVPPGDVGALAAALGDLMADPDRRARLGSAAPGRARELCDPAAALGRLCQMLESISTPIARRDRAAAVGTPRPR